ncbi:acyl-CoA dehydrogenase [Xylophilus sp. Kf1]|nr:acyl-CoA dehydrogenase [Xylophilus sp. Kf1]
MLNPTDIAHLQDWQGRTETAQDRIAPGPVVAMNATMDIEADAPAPGTPLPELWHWLYFLPHQRQSDIGPDGHGKRGGFLPPVPLPRRMWAGGRLRWVAGNPVTVGQAVERRSHILSVQHKAGRSGELVFVTVRHELHNPQGLAVSEEHDIVYRAAAQPGEPVPPPVPAETGAAWQRDLQADPVLLFRYSALTFNGHRIHYDRAYVTGVEGYPGLIVHGPLIATLLVDLARRHAPERRLAGFEFRAVRPTFDIHAFRLNGQPSPDGTGARLWAQDHEGFLTMQATATFA